MLSFQDTLLTSISVLVTLKLCSDARGIFFRYGPWQPAPSHLSAQGQLKLIAVKLWFPPGIRVALHPTVKVKA